MAAIPLKITDNGNGILVQGTNNVFFPDNATLTFPYNSIILIVDESDMVTFRSAANNDVLFSGQIGKIEIGEDTVTKANIIEKFDAVANQATGGGDIDYSGLFAGVSYDSQTKHINFYDKDDTLVTYVDATAFIKDGMVDTVVISNGNLVITFNTDAGKQPISIPLTDIFNPANYYDKTATDTLLAAKADSSSLATVATSGSYNDLTNKPTIPTVPTNVSAFTNDAGYLTQHQSLDNYYTKSEVDTELADKQDTLTAGTGIDITNNVISATGGTQVQSDWNQSDSSAVDYIKNKPTIPDTSDFVTKAEYNPKEVAIANALTQLNDNKADKTELPDTSTFATKTELNGKQDTLTAGQNITIQNNVISATGGGASYQYYSETDEEQENGTTINRHKSGMIEITDEGGTIDSGMGTSYEEIEEDGSITQTNVSSLMYADKDDGETVNGATIAVNYNYASMSVTEEGEDNGTQYSKFTDFLLNPNGFTVEVSGGGVTTQLELNDSGLSINGDNVLTVNDAYTKTQVDTALNGKQDTLTAGTGISIQNNVISATGGGGTQVQSDWNQSDSSAVDYIKNKPTIPTVPTTVSSFTNDAHYVPSSDNTIQNIVKKEQSEYDTLVNNSQVDPNTLYIIVPDSI